MLDLCPTHDVLQVLQQRRRDVPAHEENLRVAHTQAENLVEPREDEIPSQAQPGNDEDVHGVEDEQPAVWLQICVRVFFIATSRRVGVVGRVAKNFGFTTSSTTGAAVTMIESALWMRAAR